MGTAWYILHHGLYHPRKPGKIRIFFDRSAKFMGKVLNDMLYKGQDLQYHGTFQRLSKRGKSSERIHSTPILSLPPITVSEMETLTNVQWFHFLEELELFSKSENATQLKKSSSLRSLDPILVNGILRVSRRLSLVSTAFEVKH